MKKLLAASGLALACPLASALILSTIAFAAPVSTYVDIVQALDVVDPLALDACILDAAIVCADEAMVLNPEPGLGTNLRYTIASLHEPALIDELPIYLRIDPGRLAGDVT